MSGGFFRGTSADQDTRFSNKQAKLLKSQKFAAELENLVDMTKVKMDVMRPWIAKRVTELIGFEDEVLINFIYSLLEGKAVNGKQVQISLTGFMERNTGKFMKELWALLLSAQQNVSGVPQQFLDAKEEETKTKKAETERIATEIQKKKEKEKQEFEEEKMKMDGDGEKSSDKCNELAPNMKLEAGEEAADEKERYKRNGRRRSSRGSQSPGSSYHSPSLRGRRRSRSISRTQSSKSSSISLERRDRSSQRRSVTPRRHIARRSPSPWRRSYHLRRRSSSHSRRRSPSPTRYRVRSPRHRISRSPMHRRSRSPVRRRSRSPIWRSPRGYRSRTPTKRRSQYTMQGRSPSPRGRSPSPVRRRLPSPAHRPSPSPARHHSRSPVRRYSRSPARLRSRSPLRRHSRSPLRRHSRSPLRRYSTSPRRQSPSPARRQHRRSPSSSLSPVRRTSSMHGHHGRRRSFIPGGERSSPQEPGSPSPASRNSVSPVMRGSLKNARSPIKSPGERNRSHEKYSPARRASPRERAEPAGESRKRTKSVELRPVVSLRSPQRDMVDRSESHGKRYLSPSIEKSPYGPDASIGGSDSEERRFVSRRRNSHKRSPLRKAVQPEARHDSSGTSMGDGSHFSNREIGVHRDRSSEKISPMPPRHKDSRSTVEIRGLTDGAKTRKSQLSNSDRPHDTLDNKEYRGRQDLSTSKTTALSVKNREPYDGARTKDEKIDQAADVKGGHQIPEVEGLQKLSRKSEQNDHNVSLGKENDERRDKTKEKRKHKKSERHDDSDDYSSSDSYEERKEAKRRRREEKKLKKEDRRRRREEKRRKKDERRAEKNKLKSGDAGSLSPDLARLHSEDEGSKRRVSRASNIEEKESEQKKLEIELREKALESLRAKKGF